MAIYEIGTRHINPDDELSPEEIVAIAGPFAIGVISRIELDDTKVKFRVEEEDAVRVLAISLGDGVLDISLPKNEDRWEENEVYEANKEAFVGELAKPLQEASVGEMIFIIGRDVNLRYLAITTRQWNVGDIKDTNDTF